MKHPLITGSAGLCFALVMALSACSMAPATNPEMPSKEIPAAAITMLEGGLLRSGSGNAELSLTLLNRLQQPLWVSMHFQTPEGLTDCVLFKELEPGGDRLFVCPQPTVHARVRYPIHIKVFTSVDQSEPIETIDTSLKFKDADVQAL